MGYQSMVRGNVRKAFSLLKDLAVDVTLTEAGSTGFDFDAGAPVIVTAPGKYIKGVIISESQVKGGPQDSAASNMQVLFKATDVADPSLYDTMTTRDLRVWKLTPPYTNDGYVVTATLVKGV